MKKVLALVLAMEKNPSSDSERTVQTLVFQKFFWNHRSCLQLLFS